MIVRLQSGCRLWCTGQVVAISSSLFFSSSVYGPLSGKLIVTTISPILRGLEAIIFSTWHSAPTMFMDGARMAIVVTMQVASAVATRSVGEKRSPFPWLSTGASVSMVLPERRCLAVVRRSPVYTTFEVIAIFL